ncbi:MAG: MarR family winged helix-turn-helix transcriptional regulator [Acidobacteriaceae bacterium]
MKEHTAKPPSDLQTHIGFWLRFVSNHVSHAFAQRLVDSGVTVAEWVILREMFDREGTAPSDLAEITGLTRGAISKLADRLIAKQLLARTYAKDDRRYQTLALTPAGRDLVPQLAKLADDNDEEFFAALSPKQRKRLVTTLKKLVEANNLRTVPLE